MRRVRHLLKGNEFFRRHYFSENEGRLLALAQNGQNPRVLFIGCADSRVIPSMITNTDPGSLFVLRNVGNFVAPYKPDEDYHAMASGIEYAVNILGVSEIIVCGHTQCGAIAALYDKERLDEADFIHTRKWLSLGEKAKNIALEALGENADRRALQELTEQLSVVTQIDNLLTYPYVRDRVEDGRLHPHGWMYEMETGGITCYDPGEQRFRPSRDVLR